MSDHAALKSHQPKDALKLIFGAGGIYVSFLYYGTLQEDVFDYSNYEGVKFTQAWLLQVFEATINVLVGYIGLTVSGGTKKIPQQFFAITGASQVCAKAFTNQSLAYGLSFPVATLAKSGKMAPVMAGQYLLSGTTYRSREYLQVGAIIAGTAILSLQKKKGDFSHSSLSGVIMIFLSLIMDGVTAGFQKKLKSKMEFKGMKPKPYDFMFWTNLYMMIVAIIVAFSLGEIRIGLAYCFSNPLILRLIMKFSLCSAIGQSFIFYTVAHFDPLVCSTVTTTRKIFSVLLSIFVKGHQLNAQGWFGVLLACGGVLSEIQNKISKRKSELKIKQTNVTRL